MLNKSEKKKMGRPRMAQTAKDVLIGARFGRDEADLIEAAAKRSARNKSEWVRNALLNEAQKKPQFH
jgi:uncharacterized protein (DUF1778 family)